jgi:hypothetical protein
MATPVNQINSTDIVGFKMVLLKKQYMHFAALNLNDLWWSIHGGVFFHVASYDKYYELAENSLVHFYRRKSTLDIVKGE